jgi:hypothetical protein
MDGKRWQCASLDAGISCRYVRCGAAREQGNGKEWRNTAEPAGPPDIHAERTTLPVPDT